MRNRRNKTTSLQFVSDIYSHYSRQFRIFKENLSKNKRIFIWVLELIIGVIPWIIIPLIGLAYKDEAEVVERCILLRKSIISDGSALWLSISVLAFPLIEYFLNENFHIFNDFIFIIKAFVKAKNNVKENDLNSNLNSNERSKQLIVVYVSVFFIVVGVCLYFLNIVNDYEYNVMMIISILSFFLFTILSWLLSFKFNSFNMS